MNTETITDEQIKKILANEAKRREQMKQWREAHRETVLSNQRIYNKQYFNKMKEIVVHCPHCQMDMKKISYPKHLKAKSHLTKLSTKIDL